MHGPAIPPGVRALGAVLAATLVEVTEDAAHTASGSIPRDMTFLQWCENLAANGLKVDGKPFSLADRPSLVPLYQAIPTTIEEANRQTLVLMKGSQMGATVWEILADIYLALKFEPVTVGLYLPDQATAADKSERRFMRVLRSIPEIHRRLTMRVVDGGRRVGEGNVLTRILGESAFLFLWTSGSVTTESRPCDIVSLDEVQQITAEQIDRVYERMSASHIRYRLMLSTANMPDQDIARQFAFGTQNRWHTECPRCLAETDLSAHWPGCCLYNEGQIAGAPVNEWVYVCPVCAGWIENTQRGRFIAANPGASVESYHLSQIMSPTITPRDMAEAWNHAETGDLRKTFYNRKLGLPYLDKDQLPVTMADCLACVADGVAIGLKWEINAVDTVVGIDQMGSHCVVIVKRRLPDNRQAVVHVEGIYDDNPFARCSQIMREYGVGCCALEQLPNANDARRFQNEFRGRVYLVNYSPSPSADLVVWGDAVTRSDRKTSEEDRSRYTCTISQYKAMQAALFRIKNRHCLFPDPALLEQDIIERGEKKRVQIVRDYVFRDFTKTALVVEQDEETRANRPKVLKTGGIDPHFSYANCLADIAWARVHGASQFFLPQGPTDDGTAADKVAKSMPGLPKAVLAMLDIPIRPGTCSSCAEFDRRNNRCAVRQLNVTGEMVACVLHHPLG